jgi:copper chaperone CopZ
MERNEKSFTPAPKTSRNFSRRYFRLSRIQVKLVCKECAKHVEKTVREINGVRSVRCNPDGLLEVRFNPVKTDTDKIKKVISESGHDTTNHKAKAEFYAEKPKCCQYREEIEHGSNFVA